MLLSRWVSLPVRTRRWLLGVGGLLAVAAVVGLVAWITQPAAPAAKPKVQTELGPVDNDEDHVPTAPPPAALVSIRTSAGQKVMADGQGYTLYAFSADSSQLSRCTGACARRWIPLTSSGGKPQAGAGASLSQIGSFQRPDGSFQVTYNGWPLYRFSGDTKPAEQSGAGRTEYGGRFSPAPPAINPS
jgi:predicted lipoprotein with Yx(FWY)xxD motif